MKYRPEIDGLRGIAILAVVLCHMQLLAGGFLGVDIFFVISGYLITSIIIQDLDQNKFSFIKFYDRRARRILPTLFIVVLSSIVAGWYIMSPLQLKNLSQSIISVMLFASNYFFWKKTGYFDEAAEVTPMLHTWSLSVEEQFYILFPFIVFLIWRYARNYLAHAIILCLLISLLQAQIICANYPKANFYLLSSRIWELMAGAILAQVEYSHGRTQSIRATKILPLAGLILIIISFICFDDEMLHPAFISIVPIIGTIAIIWHSNSKDWCYKILTSRLLVYSGLISYSIYLWHQPILAFLKIHNPNLFSNFGVKMQVMLAILALSFLSWRFIERPFRNKKQINNKIFIAFLASAFILIILLSILIVKNQGYSNRHKIPTVTLNSIKKDSTYHECDYKEKRKNPNTNWLCSIGQTNGKQPDFAVTGDSHAMAAIYGFKKAAAATNTHGVASALPGCNPILGMMINNMSERDVKVCADFKLRFFNYVKQNHIAQVFILARWNTLINSEFSFTDINSGKNFTSAAEKQLLYSKALKNTIDAYKAIGTKVTIISQVPTQEQFAWQIYHQVFAKPKSHRSSLLRDLSVSKAKHLEKQLEATKLFNNIVNTSYKYIDISDKFCDHKICPVGTLKYSYYFDTHHLSKHGAERLSQHLIKELNNLRS